MASYPTLHEVRSAATDYWNMWEQLLGAAPDLRQTMGQHSPCTMSWKVEGDIAPLEAAERLFELGDSAYIGPVSEERSVFTIRKAREVALDTLNEIKIIQRRPSRPEDDLGADSLDLLVVHGLPTISHIEAALSGTDAKCEEEFNDIKRWISIRYQGHEFKLVDKNVWDVCAQRAADLAGLELKGR
jgi:hypothetical protein